MPAPAVKSVPPNQGLYVVGPLAPVATMEERLLFRDATFESAGRVRTHLGLTTVISTAIQVVLVGVMILLPMIFIEDLPRQQLLGYLVAPPPPPPPAPAPAAETIARAVKRVESEVIAGGALRMPTHIPEKVAMIKEEQAPTPAPAYGGVVGGVPGGIPGGSLGGVIGGIIGAGSAPVLPKAVAAPQRVRVSQGVSRGMLVTQVKPQYPAVALAARIQGQVVLQAVIARDGTIQNLKVVSGHPLLIQAAIEAVRRWQYRPYLLNGEPVEVETEVTVDFKLSSS